jgi:chromosomal replication initiation ATPase DnaA
MTARERNMVLIAEIAQRYGVSHDDIFRHHRNQCASIRLARKSIVMHFRGMDYSYPKIGRLIGKHHSTVMGWAA